MKLLQALKNRLLNKTQESFPKKKILVLEGGGMRGIFLTGVLQAFTDRNYFPWKLIIGSSAGALTGAAYAADQIHIARDVFFTELLTGKFIHLPNIIRPEKHILNIDWMIDTIVNGDDPINLVKLKKACQLLITVTNCCENTMTETIYLDSKKDDLTIALKATAAMPYFYRGFVEYKNYMLLDGGLLDPIPFKKALALGYDEKDILVVVTRKKGYRKKEESIWVKSLYELHYKDPKHKYLVHSIENRYLKYNQILDDLEQKHQGIDVIYPPDDFKIDRLTQDGKKMLEGFEQGISVAKNYLYCTPFKR